MKSALVEALEAQGRQYRDVDVSGFFAPGGKPLPKVRFMVPVLAEQTNALNMAHRRAAEASAAKDDPDVLDNEKLCCIAYEACRDPENQKDRIFGSPSWMAANLSPEQIDYLVQTLNDVRFQCNPRKSKIGQEAIDLVMALCDEGAGSDVPATVFGGYERSFLTHALVMVSLRVRQLENELAEPR